MRILSLMAALAAALICGATAERAHAGVFVSITVAPPPLPVYDQPPIPGPNYMWTPGYWSWDEEIGDYYWVPGAWVAAPEPGLLWTPGYWGWTDGVYVWNAGYWGPHVGFYGGVSYGFGYTGVGFAGGYWSGGVFAYNRAAVNIGVGVNITNVYNKTVVYNSNHVSFNGGEHGIRAQPTHEERGYAHERHVQASAEQRNHHEMARRNPDSKFGNNHGKPAVAATSRAGDFKHGTGARSTGGHAGGPGGHAGGPGGHAGGPGGHAGGPGGHAGGPGGHAGGSGGHAGGPGGHAGGGKAPPKGAMHKPAPRPAPRPAARPAANHGKH